MWEVELPEAIPLGTPPFDPQLAEHASHSFATAAGITLHVTLRRGRNVHHIIEATFKGLARCLRDAVRVEGAGVPSHQGRAVTARTGRSSPSSTTGSATCARPQKALEHVGADARLTADRGLIADAAAVVLPGVGAFGRCMEALRDAGLEDVALDAVASGRPFLGICVGMQMLFDALRGGRRRARASA